MVVPVAVAAPSPAPPSTGRPHPTYKEMIVQALTELREPRGSSRRSIASYITDRFSGLPACHDALLSVHLRRLRSQGLLLLLMPGNSYLLSTEAAASGAAPSPGQKRGPGRPRKNAADLAPSSSAPFQGVKRGPGRPPRNAVPLPGVKRGPGRPPRNTTPVGVKRGPGRPRKNDTPMSLPTTAMPEGKRSRGRPRKNVPIPTAVAGAATPSGKRRPGRPPKSPKVVLPAHSGISALALLSLVAGTRRRGRPAKEKRPPSSPGSLDAALTKRGPGRPRKEKKLGVENLKTGGAVVGQMTQAGVEGQPGQAADQPGAVRNGDEARHFPSLTEKRGRGRPRKRPLETETTAAGVAALVEKRGRGRPRKGNPLAGSSAEAGSAASMGIKRGRGRPRKDTSFQIVFAEAAVGVSRHLTVGRPEKDEDLVPGKKTEIKGVISEERMETRPADAEEC